MKRNIVQILKAGNQELFYSSLMAWLLDEEGEHGLGDQFGRWFFERIGQEYRKYTVATEKPFKGGRADIFLSTEGGQEIIVENKTKSIGSQEQVVGYEAAGAVVVLLGLVPENFPVQERSRVIGYSEVLGCLRAAKRSEASLSVLVDHLISYLVLLLTPFELMEEFCQGDLSVDEARRLMPNLSSLTISENDRRFFQAVYFERLLSWMTSSGGDLILGDQGYYNDKMGQEKPPATRWIIQKNLQGPAFMEAIVYSAEVRDRLRLRDRWRPMYDNAKAREISPRIELWFRPDDVFSAGQKGTFLLGCWDNDLRSALASSGVFNSRGSRNFHSRIFDIEDLKYRSMTELIFEEMSKVWEIPRGKAL